MAGHRCPAAGPRGRACATMHVRPCATTRACAGLKELTTHLCNKSICPQTLPLVVRDLQQVVGRHLRRPLRHRPSPWSFKAITTSASILFCWPSLSSWFGLALACARPSAARLAALARRAAAQPRSRAAAPLCHRAALPPRSRSACRTCHPRVLPQPSAAPAISCPSHQLPQPSAALVRHLRLRVPLDPSLTFGALPLLSPAAHRSPL